MAAPRTRRGICAGLLVVALAAVAAFAPAVTYGFAYDDHWTIEANRALDGPLGPLVRALVTGQAALRGIPDATRPTLVVSLWIDRRLFGVDPAGHHLHSILLYALSAATAALAVLAITRRRDAALVGGLVFALAPAHAEVVAAINYREDLYASIAVLLGIAWLFQFRQRPELLDHAVLVAAALLLGLLGKESAVALAPLVLVIALCLGRRLKRRRASLAALGVVLTVWCIWRGWLRAAGRDDVPLVVAHRGALERMFRTARYVLRAALDGLVPVRWAPDYAPQPAASPWWLVPLAFLVAGTCWLARRPRGRALAAGIAVALVAPLPMSPLVSPINERADRYVFLAALGGAIVWGVIAHTAARRVPPRLRVAALVLLLGPLAWQARSAGAPWQNDGTLWRVATARAPGSPRAWAGLARVLRLEGDLDAADRAVAHALALSPTYLRAHVTGIYNSLARGDVALARDRIRQAERLGGAAERGMSRAIRCAALPPRDAARCASDPPPSGASPPTVAD